MCAAARMRTLAAARISAFGWPMLTVSAKKCKKGFVPMGTKPCALRSSRFLASGIYKLNAVALVFEERGRKCSPSAVLALVYTGRNWRRWRRCSLCSDLECRALAEHPAHECGPVKIAVGPLGKHGEGIR